MTAILFAMHASGRNNRMVLRLEIRARTCNCIVRVPAQNALRSASQGITYILVIYDLVAGHRPGRIRSFQWADTYEMECIEISGPLRRQARREVLLQPSADTDDCFFDTDSQYIMLVVSLAHHRWSIAFFLQDISRYLYFHTAVGSIKKSPPCYIRNIAFQATRCHKKVAYDLWNQ